MRGARDMKSQNDITGLLSAVLMLSSAALLLMPLSSAEDIIFSINGMGAGQKIPIERGNAEIELSLAEGVYIKSVNAESDSKLLEAYIEDRTAGFIGKRAKRDIILSKNISVPEMMPKGDYLLDMEMTYEKDGVQKTFRQNNELSVASGGAISDLLSSLTKRLPKDVSLEILNFFNPPVIERLSRELTKDELKASGLEEINLSEADIDNDMYTIEKAYDDEIIDRTFESDVMEQVEKAREDIKGMIDEIGLRDLADIGYYIAVFRITNMNTGQSTYRTKIIVTIESSIGMHDIDIVELIPKTTAEDAGSLVFSEPVVVLEDDPIVKWNFNNLPPDQKKDYSYVTKKEVREVESATVAGGEEAGLLARFVRFCLHGGWILVLALILLIFIGGPILGTKHYRKKKGAGKEKGGKNEDSTKDSDDRGRDKQDKKSRKKDKADDQVMIERSA